MGYEKSVTFKGDYVEVSTIGDKSINTAIALWTEITTLCNECNCYKILGIANSTTPMPILDSVKHQELFKQFSVDRKYKIAWVELNKEAVNNVKFLETFLLNRGLVNGKLFDSVEEARTWLVAN